MLVSAFSKTLARNLHKSINNHEEDMTHKLSKQLMRRAEFGKDFKYTGGDLDDDQKNRGISKAVNNY